MASRIDRARVTDAEEIQPRPRLQSPVDLTIPIQDGKRRSRQSLSTNDNPPGQAKKAHEKLQEALSVDDHIASRTLVEERPNVTNEPVTTPLLPASLLKMYEDATSLVHRVLETRRRQEGLDALNDYISSRWGTGFEIQYETLCEYCTSARQLAVKFRQSPLEFDEKHLRHLNHSIKRFVEDHEYPIRWLVRFEIREHGLMQSVPSLDTLGELTYKDWKCCLSINAPPIVAPNGDALLAYREATQKFPNKQCFTASHFILRSRSDSRICNIKPGSAIGPVFAQKVRELPNKPISFGDGRDDSFYNLAKFYRGISLVACSWEPDNHIQALVEFEKRDEHGTTEYWTKWLSQGDFQKILGQIEADLEISQIFTKENQLPPWTKAIDAKSGRTPKFRQSGQPSQPPRSHSVCDNFRDVEKEVSELSTQIYAQDHLLRYVLRFLKMKKTKTDLRPDQ